MKLVHAITAHWLVAIVVMLVAGCDEPSAPVPPDQAQLHADASANAAAAVNLRLVRSLAAAGPDAIVARLADPNEQLALAAARSAGRAPIRSDARADRMVISGLAEAMAVERRPAVLAAQIESMITLLANRATPLDSPSAALAALQAAADSLTAHRPTAAAAAAFVSQASSQRSPRLPVLGGNLYDGPGWKAEQPPSPARRRVKPYDQPLHTVPIIAAGELRIGDCTGDGAVDYLVIDTFGRSDGLHVRMTLYDHGDAQLWSAPLVGNDRPAAIPPGELADVDGDGRADIVYADRAGRIVVRDGQGRIVRRSESFRTLDGEPYFGPPAAGQADVGSLHLASFRGRRVDLLLARGPNLLAMTGQFATLWHIRLDTAGDDGRHMLLADLDNDGADEIVRDGVAIDQTGLVLWTWPADTIAAIAAGRLHGLDRQIVLLADGIGRVAAFDIDGQLWQVATGQHIDQLIVGRLDSSWPGRLVTALPSGGGRNLFGWSIDGIGRIDGSVSRRAASADRGKARVDQPVMVADWNRDGMDELWGRDQASVPAWVTWPAGLAVQRIAQATRVVGLHDVDGDGLAELLYFQGDSLVIHRR